MKQIKPTQIIPGRESRINPASALPVDLDPVQRGLLLQPVTTATDPLPEGSEGVSPGEEAVSLQSTETMLAESDPTPSVPAIIGVKEQIIKFMPDGTAKIDLILEIQDIDNAVEYDIRVAKDAGNV